MSFERRDVSTLDVLDRVLDKGIVIDYWARVSVLGVDLMTTIEAASSSRPSILTFITKSRSESPALSQGGCFRSRLTEYPETDGHSSRSSSTRCEA